MNFENFLRISPRPQEGHVSYGDLKNLITKHHQTIEDIRLWAVTFTDTNKGRGHFIKKRDRTSVYEEAFDVAEIRYCRSLNTNEAKPLRRYVVIKELMHVFDQTSATVECPDDLRRLLEDLQNRPLAPDASPQYESDMNAHWKALIILCPPEVRTRYINQIAGGNKTEADVAAELIFPDTLTKAVLGSYYVRALQILTE